jgi:hypothetical protein
VDDKGRHVGTVYQEAPTLAAQGERVLSTDALSGVPARERQPPALPMRPGLIESQAFASIRPGPAACIVNRDGVTGRLVAPSVGATRPAADFLAHVQRTVASAPTVPRGHFVVDNLAIHQSASLGRWVAAVSGLGERALGQQGGRGILARMRTRAAFLSAPTPTVVFHDTPVHGAWLNPIELWFSILARTVLRRGSFTSVADLQEKVLACIADSNATMATPCTWTDQGTPLAV